MEHRMSPPDSSLLAAEQALDLAGTLLQCRSLEALSSLVPPVVAQMTGSSAAFLYLSPAPSPGEPFSHHGLTAREIREIEAHCRRYFSSEGGVNAVAPGCGAISVEPLSGYRLWGFEVGPSMRSLVGIKLSAWHPFPAEAIMVSFIRFLAQAVRLVLERMGVARQLTHFNAYLTVSSLLAKSVGLQSLLETALYFCTEAVGAQEASALFLDEDRKRFRFYRTEGASRAVLEGDSFPADLGIAGAVLKTGRSEIIQDVQNDPRFYGRFDVKSGIVTRNMIAVPLVAGEEPVGVLEVINKKGDMAFSEEDRLLLHFIAEEIAFAVRNARLFDLVADSYCLQRQGQTTCEGCPGPLGSWSLCVEYRQASRL